MAISENTTTTLGARRQRAPSRTARGRLMLPKPKTRRITDAERRSGWSAPAWAIQSEAEKLLEAIMEHGHVAGQTADEWGSPLIVVELPIHMWTLRKLFAFAIARADLEPEPDMGVDDGPMDDFDMDLEEDDPSGGNCEDQGEPGDYYLF